MNATCGTCGKKHDTILEYRECAGALVEAELAAKVMDEMAGGPSTIKPPSDRRKQIAYAMDLLKTRDWPDKYTEADLKGMERRQVSQLINELQKAVIKPELVEIPAGRYAILSTHPNPEDYGDAGAFDFYQIDRPTVGRWAGRVFVRQLFGAPGDYRKENVVGQRARKVLDRIASDPKKASLAYGKESGVCGVCSSPLTNKESLDLGIGPVCRGKMGW